MLDSGTKPLHHSLVKIYKYMVDNEDCGGACGEIEVDMSSE